MNEIKFIKPKGLFGFSQLLRSILCTDEEFRIAINKSGVDTEYIGPNDIFNIRSEYTKHCVKHTVKRVVIALLVFILLMIVKSSLLIVYPGQHVLIKQFGKVARVVSTPGPTFRVPIYESEEVLPANIIYYDIQKSEGYTADKKNMIIDCYVLWKITDPLKFTQTLQNIDTANYRINTVVYNSMKTLLGTKTQDELIRGRDIIGESDGVISVVSEDTNTEVKAIDEETQVNIISSSDSEAISITSDMKIDTQLLSTINMGEYGIEVVDIKIKSLDLPAANKDAVYTRMKSERDNIATSYRSEGEKEAKILRNDADAQVPQIIAEAEKKAANEIAEGEAKYMQILSNAYNTPEKKAFYDYLRRLDALETTVDDKKTLILPSDSQLFKDLK